MYEVWASIDSFPGLLSQDDESSRRQHVDYYALHGLFIHICYHATYRTEFKGVRYEGEGISGGTQVL